MRQLRPCEIDGHLDLVVDAAFAEGPDLRHESALTRNDYAARVVRGVDSGVAANLLAADFRVQELQCWRAAGRYEAPEISG